MEGSRKDQLSYETARELCHRGFAVVNIDYRLGLKGLKLSLPTVLRFGSLMQRSIDMAAEDLARAIDYLFRHADELDINPYKIPKTETHLTGGKNLVMPCTVTMKQLEELIEKEGCEYVDVADVKNNCVVIAIPKKYYEDPNFDIIDETFGKSIKENFNKIKEFMMGTNKYVLLCMFNEYFAYATIGEDKVISPITLKVKNV